MRNGILRSRTSVFVVLVISSCSVLLTGCGGGTSSAAARSQVQPGEFFPGAPGISGEQLLGNLTFTKEFIPYSPINILSYHLTHRFSAEKGTAEGIATVRFTMPAEGVPYFFLTPPLKSSKLDGETVNTQRISDPRGVNTYTALKIPIHTGETHELEISFVLGSTEFSVTPSGGIGFLSSFTDVSNWKFLNRYGIGNFESDQFPLIWDLELAATAEGQALHTNGDVRVLEKNLRWRVEFPAHYTSSSFFLHFTNEKFTVATLSYPGEKRMIPIKLYSKDPALVAAAKAQILDLFREFEADYGPYAHESFTAYLSGTSGGMEYVGATITSVPSLDHELLHSWFARGVMPAEGRSGWIDEAIASWRDYGYARKAPGLSRAPTNLSSYSPFQASTARNSYVDGRAFLAELDMIFKDQGGYKTLLREYFALHQHQVVTTEGYLDFVQSKTTLSLRPYTDRYVYGLNRVLEESEEHSRERELRDVVGTLESGDLVRETAPPRGAGHPTALTLDEEVALR